MGDNEFGPDVIGDARDQARVVGRLARDRQLFADAFTAFRDADAKGYHASLERAGIVNRCGLVCRWMRSKECVLLCLALAGPPEKADDVPDPREFAETVVDAFRDPDAVARLAEIVEKRDPDGFSEFVDKHGLARYRHFFCHWICSIRYRLICDWICRPDLTDLPRFAGELVTAGTVMRALVEDGFDEAAAAWTAGDSARLDAVLTRRGIHHSCARICFWFCSWHCTRVCLRFGRQFAVVAIPDEIAEAFEFGQVTDRLRRDAESLRSLLEAMDRDDEKAFGEIVRKLSLERFALQICHWLCSLRCARFCAFVCPPPDTIPLFTHVGQYRVNPMFGDYTPGGTTTIGDFAFTGTIPLIGILPDATATDAVEYRFQVAQLFPTAVAAVDVVGSMILPTRIGQLQFWYWDAVAAAWTVGSADYWVNNPGTTASIPQQVGPDLVVPVNKDVKPGGWIEVPRENNLTIGGIGRFVRNAAELALLDTTRFTDEQFDLTTPPPGLAAGDSVANADRSAAPTFQILFESRKVLGGASVNSNDLAVIAFSNTRYTYLRHPTWAGGVVTSRAVCSLDIGELKPPVGTGCDRLGTELTALFTAYHPYLDSVSVFFEGNGALPAPLAPAVSADGEAASTPAGEVIDISALAPCAYILWLSVTVRLTAGFGLIGSAKETDHIAFCKSSAP